MFKYNSLTTIFNKMNKMNKRSCHSHSSKCVTCINSSSKKVIEYNDLLKIQISTNNTILKRIDEIQLKLNENKENNENLLKIENHLRKLKNYENKENNENKEKIVTSSLPKEKVRIKFINPIIDLIETTKK